MRLLSVCLAALVLAACSSSEGGGDDGPTAGQIPDKAGMTVKGIVKDSAGNGIAGVVVSDGLEVTATDERGIYYLASDLARRNFVFVSVPADCEIPATQGCPRFYRKIDRKQAVNRADFTLTRRKTPSDRHSLIVMADIQLAADNTSVDSYLGHVVPDVLKTVRGFRRRFTESVWATWSGTICRFSRSTVRGWRRLVSRPSACRATTITIRPS